MPPLFLPVPPSAMSRRAVLLSLGATIGLAGCAGADPFAPNPDFNTDTQATTFVVYPLSTSSAVFVSAVDLANVRVVRPQVGIVSGIGLAPNFDFAVDRAADGRVLLVPSRLVAGLGTTGRNQRTGFRVVTTPFDSVAAAPSGAYQSDSVTTVSLGQTVIVENEALKCSGSARSTIFAKLVVDSISAPSGAVFLRALVNTNCGFRSLRPGRPTS